ncbi:uncharacterized protein LOC130591774 [Beta vulgaris subsp. vulgaris]|uniref:uncharacterized protein LOC130591774 n=1 Tax=Beta vulgaris subsp. vulgaris TaxID=3555 RepID=UPI002548F99D|nr:uncharacterized protein LOC130591774 [Beta vulgaris subsp. vulgaris]
MAGSDRRICKEDELSGRMVSKHGQVLVAVFCASQADGIHLCCFPLPCVSLHGPSNVPEGLFWPVFVIVTLAAVIASQAIISATFSVTKQAMALVLVRSRDAEATDDVGDELRTPLMHDQRLGEPKALKSGEHGECIVFFPPRKTAKLRNAITSFTQLDGESLYEAWERYKDLERQCPHHEIIPTWLLIQTFYNRLAHEVRISIDAAARGALMGKTAAQAKGGKYEVDAITSLSSKVDALSQQIKSISVGANTEINDFQGNNANSISPDMSIVEQEQVNVVYGDFRPRNDPYSNTFNPGWRNHENFSWSNNQPQAPRNSNPPGFQQRQQGPPSQQPPQKSYTDSLLERLLVIFEEMNKKFDKVYAHNKIVDTQTTQLAQQMSHVTQQTLEEPMKPIVTSSKVDKDGISKEVEKSPSNPARVYVEPAPFPHRLAKARIENKYGKFLELLKDKKKIYEATIVELFEECSAILLNTLPPKLNDLGTFTIPCSIGDVTIQRTLYDLGASISLMPNAIFKKLNFGDLRLTHVSLQLADRSVQYPLGILEDVPLQVGKLTIPCDFFVMEMPKYVYTLIILGRPCLTTTGALIDVKHGKL